MITAIQFAAYGGPEVLAATRVPSPIARPGEVVIDVHAASVNPIDWKIRSGMLQKVFPVNFPMTTGRDGAGVITAVGEGVSPARIGERVCFMATVGLGTWAERVVVPATFAIAVPESLSMTDAAALPLAGLSAWAALVNTAPVAAGTKVLVHAGAGGVGVIAIQLARHLGASVATTCSSANVDFVISLGADRAIAYDKEDFAETLSGYDIVFDMLGGDIHRRSYRVLRKGGTMVCLVAAPFESQAEAYGVTVAVARVQPDPAALTELVRLADREIIKPVVRQVLPFAQFAEAQRLSERGHGHGKIVLALR